MKFVSKDLRNKGTGDFIIYPSYFIGFIGISFPLFASKHINAEQCLLKLMEKLQHRKFLNHFYISNYRNLS